MADEILNVEQQNEAPHNITIYKGDNIRDKELIEAESATTAQSGDSVVLKTTAGTYVEIDRDSFAEVIREQLGRLIKGTTDKGTTINGIAAMDASNDLGWVSAANLASVLGGNIKDFSYDQTLPVDTWITVPVVGRYNIIFFQSLSTGSYKHWGMVTTHADAIGVRLQQIEQQLDFWVNNGTVSIKNLTSNSQNYQFRIFHMGFD